MAGGHRGLGPAQVAQRDAIAAGKCRRVEKPEVFLDQFRGGGRKLRAASASAPRMARTRAGSVQRSQVAAQLGAVLVALFGFLAHQLANHRGERRRNAARLCFEWIGIFHALPEDLVDHVAPLKGRLAGQREVEGAADAVQIAPHVGLGRVAKLFGAGVIERAQHRVGPGQPGLVVQGSCQTHVEQLHVAVGRDHDVRRLDIAMDQPGFVGRLETVDQLEEQAGRVGDPERTGSLALDEVDKGSCRGCTPSP